MHTIEPFYRWENLYTADSDERSPFYGREYDMNVCRNDVYGYYIHPAWDEFGSETLYLKIIYTDYKHQFAIIEFIGEWNDAIHNDISYLKRNLIDYINREGIIYYILIGENVLNFHGSDDCYYEEWYEDIEDKGGWICAIGFRKHIIDEWKRFNVDSYVNYGGSLELTNWRTMHPLKLFQTLKTHLQCRLGA